VTNQRGVTQTGSILDRIVADGREDLARRKREASEVVLRERFAERDEIWDLTSGITTPRGAAPADKMQIVAEIKKASPSKGVLAENLDPVAIARAYAAGGATGISILTEPKYFLGSLEYLLSVREVLERELPGARPSLLRKDFITDPYEVIEARAFGADNVLLIVAMLDLPLLQDLLETAREVGLGALVEVHNESETESAVKAGATLYGINNRDLHTFNVELATTERIRPLLPHDAVVIGESGVHTKADVERLHKAGVRAILVGEAFMTAPDVAAKMAELRL
jgi:indole-3-glycerol phosphate synthase